MFLLLADTHLGLSKSSDLWHDVTINLFKKVVDTALRKDIHTIIHLGDFFDERKSTNNKTLEVAYQIEEVLKPISNTYIITGNHDIYYKNKLKPSSLSIFKNSNHINVITEPYFMNPDMVLIPWGQDIPQDSNCKYCFGHFEINSFFMNSKAKCSKAKLNTSDFNSFEHVYSGHFHTPSTQGNITYLGSPFQQSFHDVGSSRGYYIFSNDGELEFIEFKDYPKFTNVKSSDTIDEELIKNNIINFVFEEDYGTNKNMKLVEHIQSLSPQSLKVDFGKIPIEDDDMEMENIVIEGHDTILNEYIDQDKNRPKGLDKKKIKQLLNKMLEEVG